MDQSLTITGIQTQYPSEWILIEDPVTNDRLEVQSGKVLWHSSDRDEVYRKAVELRPTRSAFVCTIPMPENAEFVL